MGMGANTFENSIWSKSNYVNILLFEKKMYYLEFKISDFLAEQRQPSLFLY